MANTFPLLTAQQRQSLRLRNSPLGRLLKEDVLLGNAQTWRYEGRPATGHIRIATNPTDGDTVTIGVGPVTKDAKFYPGLSVIYEFQATAAAAAGHVKVATAATAILTAAAFAAVINANQGAQLTATRHATDTTVVDLVTDVQGSDLTLAASAATRTVVQDNDAEEVKDSYVWFDRSRTITAEDVTRGRVRIDTGLSSLSLVQYMVITSVTNHLPTAHDGAVSTSGGVIELTVGSGTPLATGNILYIWARGQV